jgi:hypothetical protein
MPEMQHSTRKRVDNPWEDLVVSILSVNQYSLERTYLSIEGLRREGLFDPQHLMSWSQSEILERLKAAGCDRGPFMTSLFALRLSNLGVLIESKGIDACGKVISGRDTRAIEELLLPVNGIGPKVIANFYILHEVPRK